MSALKQVDGPIMVTGHTGFKGTWMTLLLEQLGLEVVGYSLPPTDSSLYQKLNRTGKIPEVFGDVRNEKELNGFFLDVKPKYVIHMAAQSLVIESYARPEETFDINVMGTVNVLNASSKSGSVKTIGVVTTDKVYKNNNLGRKFIESDPLEGNDPYSASKVAAESVVKAWNNLRVKDGGPIILALRAGNVIGGGDLAENRIMPDVVRSMISGEAVTARNPNSTRPWQHVLDPLFGYLLAILNSKNTQSDWPLTFNFGPIEPSLSVTELLEIVESNFSGLIKINFPATELKTNIESQYLDLNSNLAREILLWEPAWSQKEAIISTINWWQRVIRDETSALQATRDEIEKFLCFHDLKKVKS